MTTRGSKLSSPASVSASGAAALHNGAPKKELLQALATLKSKSEFERFLTDLCTPAELRALAARWQVAQLLNVGDLSYREISERTGASTTTVGRVARFLHEEPHQGYQLALARVRS